MSVLEADEYERLKPLHGLLSDLDRAKRRAEQDGAKSDRPVEIPAVLSGFLHRFVLLPIVTICGHYIRFSLEVHHTLVSSDLLDMLVADEAELAML